jgi:hypothetical protein
MAASSPVQATYGCGQASSGTSRCRPLLPFLPQSLLSPSPHLCSPSPSTTIIISISIPLRSQAYLKPPNTDEHDAFGERAIAIQGDTIAVGARFEDSCSVDVSTYAASNRNCKLAGAAYVFIREGLTWSSQAYIKAPNAEAGAVFGYSLSLSTDILAVGAHLEDSCATAVMAQASNDQSCDDAGAVYVVNLTPLLFLLLALLLSPVHAHACI